MNPRDTLQHLQLKSPVATWAFLFHKSTVYYSGYCGPKPFPSSAVVKLLQGLFDQHRDLSFFLLRSRIFTCREPGPMDKGFIDLVAKRWSVVDVEPSFVETGKLETSDVYQWEEVVPLNESFFRPSLERHVPIPGTDYIGNFKGAVAAITFLESQIPRGEVLHDHSRPIAAILCDSAGKVLGQSLHSGSINKTLHAEIDLIQQLYRAGFNLESGEKFRMYVSLKPCRMCAGTWAEVFGDQVEVFYLRDDLGSKARMTELEKRGLIQPLPIQDLR